MMKRQQLDQARQKTAAELRQDVAKLEHELIDNRMKGAQGTINNVRSHGLLRRQIAQLKSLIQVKELA